MPRAKQGEVNLATPSGRIGFGRDQNDEGLLVLVVQGEPLNAVLDTVQVAPLVPETPQLRRFPLNVPVPAAEIPGRENHVAQTHLVRPVALSRLAPGPVAVVSQQTLARVLATLERVFE